VRHADAEAAPVGSADQKRNITHQGIDVIAFFKPAGGFKVESSAMKTGWVYFFGLSNQATISRLSQLLACLKSQGAENCTTDPAMGFSDPFGFWDIHLQFAQVASAPARE